MPELPPRAENNIKKPIPLGLVVYDKDGEDWIFIGWSIASTGRAITMARSAEGRRVRAGIVQRNMSILQLGRVSTIIDRFPSMAEYIG